MTIFKNTSYIDKLNIQKRIKKYLKQHSTASRLDHCLEVAKLAKKLCLHYNIDPYQGIIAGLGHDIARELSPALIRFYTDKDSLPVSNMEIRNPQLLHGRAGAVILQTEIEITDQEILSAVRDHVLGKPDMSMLSKIIFAADFLEPKRNILPEAKRKRLLQLPIEEMLLNVLSLIFSYLKKQNYPIAEQSICMYKRLKECLDNSETN